MTTKHKYKDGNNITEILSRPWPFANLLLRSILSGFTLDLPQNLEVARMRAYSVSARNTKASLVMIHTSSGLRLALTGLEAATELFRLISMRRRVRRRPRRPGTTSGLIRKLTQLTTTIRAQGAK